MIGFFAFGLLFYLGALIKQRYNTSTKDIFYAVMAIVWSGWYAGHNFYFMPDVAAAKQSARNLFTVLDQEDEDGIQERMNSKKFTGPIHGKIEVNQL